MPPSGPQPLGRVSRSWVRATAGAVAAATFAALASGCALFGGGDGPVKPDPSVRLKDVSIAMSAEANDGWPVAVEVVRVRDEAVAGTLLRIDSADWFEAEGNAFRQAHPYALYDFWEVVPGTTIGPFDIHKRGRFAGILFCGMRSTKPPLRLTRNGDLLVYVDGDGCNVSEAEDATGTGNDKWWKPW